jgi:membrane protein DedA with SNARE-associated domain
MWPYVLVFLAALGVDTIPIFAPPAWTLLVFLLITFRLNPWAVVAIGVTGSTIGRYVLSRYIPKLSSTVINRREDENLRYIGERLGRTGWAAALFIFLYTLTPLSTTALFTAVGIARVSPWHILPPFFFGRLITDGVMVYTGKYAVGNVSDVFHGQVSARTVITLVVAFLILAIFLFLDWRLLLEKHKLRLNFRIFKWQARPSTRQSPDAHPSGAAQTSAEDKADAAPE